MAKLRAAASAIAIAADPKPPISTCSRTCCCRSRSAQIAVAAPTLITFGRYDVITGARFADVIKSGIAKSELIVFEDCSHAPIYENVSDFNHKTLAFLKRNTG